MSQEPKDHSQTVGYMFLDGKLTEVRHATDGVLWSAERGDTIDDALANPTVANGLLVAIGQGGKVDLTGDDIHITPPFHVPFGGSQS